MIDIDPLLLRYAEQHSSSIHSSLEKIDRSTHLNAVKPSDSSDFLQGRTLSFISKLLRPMIILEIGTFTAYATVCLSEGLQTGGKVITIESKNSLQDLIEEHLKIAGVTERVEVIYGKALDIIPHIIESIDMVYMDANKREYPKYYEMLLPKISSGGIIVADNVLWKGDVLKPIKSKMAEELDHFNEMISRDDRVESFILPYRDGLSIIRKK